MNRVLGDDQLHDGNPFDVSLPRLETLADRPATVRTDLGPTRFALVDARGGSRRTPGCPGFCPGFFQRRELIGLANDGFIPEGATAVLLLGVVRLTERRAAFVSAVTHELRTPLTTFQFYADLLGTADDLSDEKCRRYIETLRSEAERLRHLVKNVLAWSRLERTAERDR